MFGSRLTAVLGLLALSSCSMFAKGKSSLGSGAPSAGGVPGGVGPKVDDDDPPHVARAIERLDAMAKLIEARSFAEYARESADFQGTFIFQNGWAGEKKRDSMKSRLDALDAAAFKAHGGRLTVVGDAKRVLKLDTGTVAAVEEAVDACDEAAKTPTSGGGGAAIELAKRVKAYEATLARVTKMDATAFRYFGEARRGTIDVPTKLMKCEVALAAAESQYADEYIAEETPKGEVETGCGVISWVARGVSLGGGRWSPYERAAGGASFPERLACNKLPKTNKLPAPFRSSAQDFASYVDVKLASMVNVIDGKPTVETSDEDLRVYRYQSFNAYSKQWKFAKNPCGEGKLFCEAGGSRGATAYNKLEHALDRAAVHAGGNPDRCGQHLQEAKNHAKWFAEFHADAVKSGSWITGATYKTKKGEKLPEKAFIAAFEAKGKLADDRLIEKYCAKPAPKK